MTTDLHSHSHYSDGDQSPAELVALAEEAKLTRLALTDHDSVAGLAEFRRAAASSSVTAINGIELSASWRGQVVHVVGLNVSTTNPVLQQGIAHNQQLRLQRDKIMRQRLEGKSVEIECALAKLRHPQAVATRPHLALALVQSGYAKDIQQAFRRYLVRGKSAYVPCDWPSLAEVGAWIQAAGGVAALAHPHRYGLTRKRLGDLFSQLEANGIEAVEVSTATTNQQQTDMLCTLAGEQNLYASVGSDFHSQAYAWAPIGKCRPIPDHLRPVWSLF